MIHQQSLSTSMPVTSRLDDGADAIWGVTRGIAVDCLLELWYGLQDRGREVKPNLTLLFNGHNGSADSLRRSGRYRLKVTVPI
ncbi:hypothetical protein [Microseira sp. BLCC-F43]|uniref:hypothetical protein n=1 Tax=Microseira sp. BLCC-F43 TaxID=3153602 RepID=UPI0035BA26FA